MRIPLTKYGLPEVAVYPALVAAIMLIYAMIGIRFLPVWAVALPEILFTALFIWILSFFRDPSRKMPALTPEKDYLLSPADGKVTNIDRLEKCDFIDAPALRIGIFMSIFNVHINRSPCNARVEQITYKPGKNKNAANPASGRTNQSNTLALVRTEKPNDKLLVRQISGAIARRIVCRADKGRKLAMGEKFGMVKFGSRCELYVPYPVSEAYLEKENTQYTIKCLVRLGDKVKAGLTPILKYEIMDKVSGCLPLEAEQVRQESSIGKK